MACYIHFRPRLISILNKLADFKHLNFAGIFRTLRSWRPWSLTRTRWKHSGSELPRSCQTWARNSARKRLRIGKVLTSGSKQCYCSTVCITSFNRIAPHSSRNSSTTSWQAVVSSSSLSVRVAWRTRPWPVDWSSYWVYRRTVTSTTSTEFWCAIWWPRLDFSTATGCPWNTGLMWKNRLRMCCQCSSTGAEASWVLNKFARRFSRCSAARDISTTTYRFAYSKNRDSQRQHCHSQKFSTGGASICSIPFCPVPLMVMHTLCAGFVWSLCRLDLA